MKNCRFTDEDVNDTDNYNTCFVQLELDLNKYFNTESFKSFKKIPHN